MFKPCPKCGFLVALIAGREASQRCPRCGSGLVEPDEILTPPDATPRGTTPDATVPRDVDPTSGPDAVASTPEGARPTAGRDGRRTDRPTETDTPVNPAHAADAHAPDRIPSRIEDRAQSARTHRSTVPSGSEAGPAVPTSASTVDDAESTHAAGDGGDASAAAAPDAPTFARPVRTQRPAGRRWPGWVAITGLSALLALQLLLAQRQELAADARWRPVIARLCPVFGCALPPWREPAAFAMLARNVRPHPVRPDVLRASTTVRNDARWPQPLPVVVLSLSDVDGRIVGTRAVPPRDYSRTPRALVTPGTSVDIAFEVREPARRVVSFDFRLQ